MSSLYLARGDDKEHVISHQVQYRAAYIQRTGTGVAKSRLNHLRGLGCPIARCGMCRPRKKNFKFDVARDFVVTKFQHRKPVFDTRKGRR